MVTEKTIYEDIAERTGGDIYVGVVGPVRTGKSTFIKRFMESLVLPEINSEFDRERARDEMPQSAAGRTVMTTEPKFVPDEAVSVMLGGSAEAKVRLIDCVGYIVPEALGHIEDGSPRMVMTPWSPAPMPFEQAAEFGTKKVISDHSTIGVLVTTDGSISDIPRSSYVESEARVAGELRALGKPFVIVLNSAHPESEESTRLALELEEKYGAPVALLDCLRLDAEDLRHVLELVLLEFPVTEIGVRMPSWTAALPGSDPLSEMLAETVLSCGSEVNKISDIDPAFHHALDDENIKSAAICEVDLGTGRATVDIKLDDGLYFSVLSKLSGKEISSDEELMQALLELAAVSERYEKVAAALAEVEEKGYGIVTPDACDLELEEPEITDGPGGYGVRLRASAPSIHMMKANIETEINPIVGSEEQSKELVQFMLREFEEDPKKIWQSNMFGKTLYELVTEGLHAKLDRMPAESRKKFSETLERLINEGNGGMICIIL